MKWPTDKSDRQKIFALIGIAVLAALYGLWLFVYQPLVERRLEAEQEIERLERNLRRAQTEIRQTPTHQRDLLHYVRETLNLSEQHLLHPVLGNYELQARSIARQSAAGLEIRSIRAEEVGLVALPRRRGEERGAALVQAYALRVTALAGFADTAVWIQRLSEENPLVTIHTMSITAQPGNPLLHQVRFEVHWPVWVDPAMRHDVRTLAESLVEDAS